MSNHEFTCEELLRHYVSHGFERRFWYQEGQEAIEEFCSYNRYDPIEFTAVLSITSPRTSVAANVRSTCEIMDDWRRTGRIEEIDRPSGLMSAPFERALSVLGNPGQIERLRSKTEGARWASSGWKTSAFFRNLTGDLSVVTCDVWIAKAMRNPKIQSTLSGYKQASDVIRRIAARYDIQPAEAQAAMWYGYALTDGGRKTMGSFAELLK